MNSFSIWHWIIVLTFLVAPIFIAFRKPPSGANTFGSKSESVAFGRAVQIFFQKYVDFRGRASRSEFWFAVLFTVVTALILSVVDKSGVLNGVFTLATILPSVAQNARRLHDTNRSGWLQMICFLGPIGLIVLIVWLAEDSQTLDGNEVVPKGSPTRSLTLDEIEMLGKLAKLRESGAISEEEYQEQKKKLLP